MNKKIWLKIVLLAIIVASYVGYKLIFPKPTANQGGEEIDLTTSYSLETIAEHNSKESCWMAIEGKVYDLTPFVASGFHPGGEAILAGCGIDATELFNSRPSGSKTPHSATARRMMEKYQIGMLGN